jgi:hypothetical protein
MRDFQRVVSGIKRMFKHGGDELLAIILVKRYKKDGYKIREIMKKLDYTDTLELALLFQKLLDEPKKRNTCFTDLRVKKRAKNIGRQRKRETLPRLTAARRRRSAARGLSPRVFHFPAFSP